MVPRFTCTLMRHASASAPAPARRLSGPVISLPSCLEDHTSSSRRSGRPTKADDPDAALPGGDDLFAVLTQPLHYERL